MPRPEVIRVAICDAARRELEALPSNELLATVLASSEKFLTRRRVPGGKVEKVGKGKARQPDVWEFRIEVKDGWVRLLYFERSGTRYVVSCIRKKSNRLRPGDIATALSRAAVETAKFGKKA